MPLTAQDFTRNYVDDGSSLERIAHRKIKLKFEIVKPNPAWLRRFLDTKDRIQTALGPTILGIQHIGSTSVPNLPAKDVIDIDLVVHDIHDEASYVSPLERTGFSFLFREPSWHQHRFFVDEGDNDAHPYPVNLHVFGPDCPEVERHRIFRDWLVRHPEDVDLYARVKRECAEASEGAGESMDQYTVRKGRVVQEILGRALSELGYVE